MDAAELLSALRERDVRLWIEDGRLKCSAPVGALSAELRATLASRKEEILFLLRQAASIKDAPPAIVPLKADGRRPPLFAVPGHNGDVFAYVPLARYLDADQPLLGVQPPGLDGSEPIRSIEALARYEAEQIRRYRPEGPYLIAGYCAGGTIAFEIARQLTEQRQHVALLALFGAPFPTVYHWTSGAARWIRDVVGRHRRHWRVLASGSVAAGLDYLVAKARQVGVERTASRNLRRARPEGTRRVEAATVAGLRHYVLRRYRGEIDLFVPSEASRGDGSRPGHWRTVADAVHEHVGPDGCPGLEMLQEPWVGATAALLRPRLEEVAALLRGHPPASTSA
jgi:thioesterase domain-containing protein